MAIKLGTKNNDTIIGTSGRDTLYGLIGNDLLNAGTGNDMLSGGDGNDTLIGGMGWDTLHGGTGNDVFKYTNINELKDDIIIDFTSADKIDLSSIPATQRHFIGNSQFSGTPGEIQYSDSYPDSSFHGGYTGPYSSFRHAYINTDVDGDGATDVTLEIVKGDEFNLEEKTPNSGLLNIAINMALKGTAVANSLIGGNGYDTISGLAGNDSLMGGNGNDQLLGGDGNDTLVGGLGSDTLTGGVGKDTFRFSESEEFTSTNWWQSPETIKDFTSDDQLVLAIQGISYIGETPFSGCPGEYRYEMTPNTSSATPVLQFDFDGDGYADQESTINIDISSNVLRETNAGSNILIIAKNLSATGTIDDDTLIGGIGNDTINGSFGNDTINGDTGQDSLIGGDGNDLISGGSGNDQLFGDAGNDTLIGGTGRDSLTGGDGNDIFKYSAINEISVTAVSGYFSNLDYITDFKIGDRVDLSIIDANSTVVGNQAFSFIGNSGFTGIAGQLRSDGLVGVTSCYGDINGDSQADFQIQITALVPLVKTDFIL